MQIIKLVSAEITWWARIQCQWEETTLRLIALDPESWQLIAPTHWPGSPKAHRLRPREFQLQRREEVGSSEVPHSGVQKPPQVPTGLPSFLAYITMSSQTLHLHIRIWQSILLSEEWSEKLRWNAKDLERKASLCRATPAPLEKFYMCTCISGMARGWWCLETDTAQCPHALLPIGKYKAGKIESYWHLQQLRYAECSCRM